MKNHYYCQYYLSSDSEEEYEINNCSLCNNESNYVNNWNQCVECEIKHDEILPRINELPLYEINNIIFDDNNYYWFNNGKFNKVFF